MCLICVELNAGRLKISDAWRNLQEIFPGLDDKHKDEVLAKIENASLEAYVSKIINDDSDAFDATD